MKTSIRKSFCFASGIVLLLAGSAGRNALAQGQSAGDFEVKTLVAQSASGEIPDTPAPAVPDATADVPASSSSNSAVAGLPEAPQPVLGNASPFSSYQAVAGGTASRFSTSIEAGMTAQKLSAGDKFLLGFRAMASPYGLAGTVIGAGYTHLINGEPNYGTDRGAFGERVGAGVLRSASQDFFTISVLSPVLHEDPRYYVQGPQRPFIHRVLYAVTRPIIGRTDGGRTTVNASMLIGYAGAAALTTQYYPPANHNFHDVAATYGTSLGGSAIGFVVDEFADQLLRAIHLRK
ncbi:MAG TPA: hypothetical protein VGN16_23260 [Acidobacteriaceae bacterium]